jgi:hypothetical protein
VLAAVPVLVAGTACYEYRSAPVESIEVGKVIHATFTPDGSRAAVAALGPQAAGIEARVVSRTAADVTFAVSRIERAVGPEQFLRDEPVTLPISSLGMLEVRSADRPRTALAIGGIIAAVVAGQVFINQSGVFSTKGAPPSSTK